MDDDTLASLAFALILASLLPGAVFLGALLYWSMP